MRRLRTQLSPTLAGLVILVTSLSFLADFPAWRSRLDDSLNDIFPVGAALLPYIALAGIVYSGGQLGIWLIGKGIDLLRNRSRVREFQALEDPLGKSKRHLIQYVETPSSSPLGKVSDRSALIVELNLIVRQLIELDIQVPDFGYLINRERSQSWVAYLAAMEELAKGGRLQDAREGSINRER